MKFTDATSLEAPQLSSLWVPGLTLSLTLAY